MLVDSDQQTGHWHEEICPSAAALCDEGFKQDVLRGALTVSTETELQCAIEQSAVE